MYLKVLRQKAGLTQAQLAKKLGYISPQFVSNWERGISPIPYGKFGKIASILGVSTDFLIKKKMKAYEERIKRGV